MSDDIIETMLTGVLLSMSPSVQLVFDGCDVSQVKEWRCDICDNEVTLFDVHSGDFNMFRIKGDSANGYGMSHNSCVDELYDVATPLDHAQDVVVSMTKKCPECGRKFDLSNEDEAAEWSYGHDCE